MPDRRLPRSRVRPLRIRRLRPRRPDPRRRRRARHRVVASRARAGAGERRACRRHGAAVDHDRLGRPGDRRQARGPGRYSRHPLERNRSQPLRHDRRPVGLRDRDLQHGRERAVRPPQVRRDAIPRAGCGRHARARRLRARRTQPLRHSRESARRGPGRTDVGSARHLVAQCARRVVGLDLRRQDDGYGRRDVLPGRERRHRRRPGCVDVEARRHAALHGRDHRRALVVERACDRPPRLLGHLSRQSRVRSRPALPAVGGAVAAQQRLRFDVGVQRDDEDGLHQRQPLQQGRRIQQLARGDVPGRTVRTPPSSPTTPSVRRRRSPTAATRSPGSTGPISGASIERPGGLPTSSFRTRAGTSSARATNTRAGARRARARAARTAVPTPTARTATRCRTRA